MLASRLLTLLMLLQTRGRMAATDLAARLEVSVRTVYRDIDALSAAGITVIAERGRSGGFRLIDGYRTELTGMTAEEAETVLLAGLPGLGSELGISHIVTAARLKLLAALPSGARAERVASRVHLDPAGWFRAVEAAPLLPIVARAVWDERYLQIRYRQGGEARERKVGPLGVVLKGGVWYVVAQRGGAYRSYRVSRIVAVSASNEPYSRPADFDLAAHWTQSSREYELGTYRASGTLRVSPRGQRFLDLLGPHVTQAFAASQEPADGAGWIRCKIPLESEDFGLREIARLGEDAEIVAPPALRKAMAARLRAMLQHYSPRTRRRPAV